MRRRQHDRRRLLLAGLPFRAEWWPVRGRRRPLHDRPLRRIGHVRACLLWRMPHVRPAGRLRREAGPGMRAGDAEKRFAQAHEFSSRWQGSARLALESAGTRAEGGLRRPASCDGLPALRLRRWARAPLAGRGPGGRRLRRSALLDEDPCRIRLRGHGADARRLALRAPQRGPRAGQVHHHGRGERTAPRRAVVVTPYTAHSSAAQERRECLLAGTLQRGSRFALGREAHGEVGLTRTEEKFSWRRLAWCIDPSWRRFAPFSPRHRRRRLWSRSILYRRCPRSRRARQASPTWIPCREWSRWKYMTFLHCRQAPCMRGCSFTTRPDPATRSHSTRAPTATRCSIWDLSRRAVTSR